MQTDAQGDSEDFFVEQVRLQCSDCDLSRSMQSVHHELVREEFGHVFEICKLVCLLTSPLQAVGLSLLERYEHLEFVILNSSVIAGVPNTLQHH